MSKLSAKNKLMELITGTKTQERKIIFIDEDELLDAETCDDNTTVIIFTDFSKKRKISFDPKNHDIYASSDIDKKICKKQGKNRKKENG